MQTEEPLVSICIPSYNYARYITTTIESALSQSYRNFEVVISDNGSSDETDAVLARYAAEERVRVFHQSENIGISRNVNFLIDEARGEYVVVIGADDALLPDFLSDCMARMLDGFDPVDIVYGGAIICDEKLRAVSVQRLRPQVDMPYSRRNEFAALLEVVYILFTATLFKKTAIIEAGYCSDRYKIASDWELFLRLALADKRFASIAKPVVMVRYHEAQASSASNYFFSGDAFIECLDIFESVVNEENAWRFRGHEHQVIGRLGWYDEMFRDGASLETLERHEAMVTRLKAYADAEEPAWPASVPRVSVIVVSDGDPGLLERALDSLAAQSFTDWEAVIVQYEGVSLEPLVRLRKDPQRFRYSLGHSSLAIARVRGMELARGLIIAHLHTDATFRPEHLLVAVRSLEAGRHSMVVTDASDSLDQVYQRNYGPYRVPRRVVAGLRDAAAVRDRLNLAPVVDLCCVVHRREVLDSSGSLLIDEKILGEWEFLLRGLTHHGFTLVEAVTVELHHHLGRNPAERPITFLHTIDEIYRRYPVVDEVVGQRRREYRASLEAAFAGQSTKAATVDGMFELMTTIAGLPGVAVTATAN
jgi:glycosyltransferase involved in cell wall biosynthesis